MKDYTSPGAVAVEPDENLTTALFENARTHPNRPALAYKEGGRFVDVTTREFVQTVERVAAGLMGLGIEPGSRICIMSPTRIEWTYLDYAIWAAGCVTVPIYETSSAEQVEWIASDSEAVAIFVDNDERKAIYDEVANKLKKVKHVFVIEDGGLDKVAAEAGEVTAEDVRERAAARKPEDLATLVYTSGTTGRPKGCVINHGHFVWDQKQVLSVSRTYLTEGASTLLFLPLAHIFARVLQTANVEAGVKIIYSQGVAHLMEELQQHRPTYVVSVPRVFEKVYNGAKQKAHDEGKGAIFDRAAATAIDYAREQQQGGVSLKTKLLHAVFDKLVYTKLRQAFGGNVEYAISGGAALGERLGYFFHGVGIKIMEGYGLTETTAGATLNRPDDFKIGTVGKPLPGVTIRIADDGEILIKGGNVFAGYYNNEEASKEALEDDGFFHTGDIGELDKDGFLRITGRKKELIVTAGGKNVAPAVLEDRMRAHPLVSQSMVIGDGQPFIAALIAVDAEAFESWKERHGKSGSIADLREDPDLKGEITAAVEDANKAVSRAEAIKAFRILPEDFTIEGGELTPTLKVKRRVVADKYGDVIDEIYAGTKSD